MSARLHRHSVERVGDPLDVVATRAARGDQAAFAELVESTQASIWRMCAYLVDRNAADDLTQETYLRAFRALAGYRGDARVSTWLLTISRRVCAAEIDRRSRAREMYLLTVPREQHLHDQSSVVDMDLLIAGLDDDRRTAFVLTQVVGCDYAEAAEICGCPIGTIRSRVARARADLVAALGQRTELPATRPIGS
ncbi:MAG TPA: sigma-70 family RNA polymerase sigma factor [Mycobacteriales bacterium]|nr:sigma-70 family RNA polymerase sigma factor [Mycobacteriales bacterium]